MSGCCTDAAAECCQVQPDRLSGCLAAKCPGGHEHKTGSAKGQGSLLLHKDFKITAAHNEKDQMLSLAIFFQVCVEFCPSYIMKQKEMISKPS